MKRSITNSSGRLIDFRLNDVQSILKESWDISCLTDSAISLVWSFYSAFYKIKMFVSRSQKGVNPDSIIVMFSTPLFHSPNNARILNLKRHFGLQSQLAIIRHFHEKNYSGFYVWQFLILNIDKSFIGNILFCRSIFLSLVIESKHHHGDGNEMEKSNELELIVSYRGLAIFMNTCSKNDHSTTKAHHNQHAQWALDLNFRNFWSHLNFLNVDSFFYFTFR